jgi:hypothetical protein
MPTMISYEARARIYRDAQYMTYKAVGKKWSVHPKTVCVIVREQRIIQMMAYAPAVYRDQLADWIGNV